MIQHTEARKRPAPRNLSKSKILAGLQCPRRLYLEVYHPELIEFSAGTEARFKAGHQVGALAQALFPDGILIEHARAPGEALRETSERLKSAGNITLFEPAFQAGGAYFRADILRRSRGEWHLIEVKSTTEVKEYHRTDVATQTWVLEQQGIRPARVQLAHIDNCFVYPGGGDYRRLFAFADLSSDIQDLKPLVPRWLAQFKTLLAGAEPVISPGKQCKLPVECPFRNHCAPADQQPEYPVTLLPRGGKTVEALVAAGFRDLREVPEDLLENPLHQLIHQVTLSGEPHLDPEAAKELQALGWPRYYLDFETIQFAVPIWAGTRPYQQLPFQWSCHVEQKGGVLEHREFLGLSGNPPMRAFAESLLRAIPPDDGPILGYNNGFELGILRGLAEMFPDLAAPLLALEDRFFDLLTLVRQNYYHPAMKGSRSLKAVLPTIAPDLNYASMVVQDGGMAQEAYLEVIQPETTDARREEIRHGLLAYCGMDTMALVRMVSFIDRVGKFDKTRY